MSDEDDSRTRPVLVGLAALVGVALLISAVVSVVALGLADVVGVSDGDEPEAATSAEPSLFLPSPSTRNQSDRPTPSGSPTGTGQGTGQPTGPTTGPTTGQTTGQTPGQTPGQTTEPTDPSPTKKPVRRPITLTASPRSVPPSGRIDLVGTYPGGDGATLQVQRLEGGSWADFPVTASVSAGTFSTYIYSGQTGAVRFRMLDEATGRASAPVVVNIG